MLIYCSSCNSKYLVNSVDLKPKGRKVQCAKCDFKWFQEPVLLDEAIKSNSSLYFENDVENIKIDTNKENNLSIANLPSTYVKTEEPSILNTTLIILFLIILVFVFWTIQNDKLIFLPLIKFYFYEFYFNLKLIINDIAQLTHKLFK